MCTWPANGAGDSSLPRSVFRDVRIDPIRPRIDAARQVPDMGESGFLQHLHGLRATRSHLTEGHDLPAPIEFLNEVLARLAAEFFGSFPGAAATGQTLAATLQEPPGAPHHVSLPGDLGTPPVGASPGPPVASEISPPAAVPVPQPTVPAIPGSATALASSALSGFSFPLVWLDNAATTQKPQSVIDRLSYFYAHENSNVHRAAHEMAARATDAYESAREKVRRFLNASAAREIVFVRGTTEGINLVAQSWGRQNIRKDDEIVITWLEHHANIVPWQMLCSEKEARLRVAPVDDGGQVILERVPGLRIIGKAREKAGVLSFVIDGIRTGEIGDYLNRDGIAVRAGHHCAQPIHRRFGLESTVRASLARYNTCEDLDALVEALQRLQLARRNRN